MAEDIGIGAVVSLDMSQFAGSISKINEGLGLVQAQFKEASSRVGVFGNDTESLKVKTEALTEKIDLQKQKIAILQDAYNKSSSETGSNSDQTNILAKSLLNAQTALNKMDNDLKTTTSQMETTETKTSTLGDKMSAFGSKVGSGIKVAGAAIAGMGVAVAGAAVGLGAMVTKASDSANSLVELSQQTGLSTDKLQEMQYVGGALDVSLDTMTGAHTRLIKAMTSAEKSTSTQAAAFKALGVATQDSNGHLLDSNIVFNNAMGALGGVQNATERDSLSLQLFGKSALALNPLITTGAAGLASMSAEAEKNGAVMSSTAIKGLNDFHDKLDGLKLSFQGLAGSMAGLAVPALSKFTDMAQGLTSALNTALKTGDFTQFGQVLSDGINSGVKFVTDGIAKFTPMVTKILTGLIKTLVQAIPTVLPALATGVVQIVQAIVTILQQNGPKLITAAINAVITLVKGLLQALPQIMQAAIQMVVALADSISAQLPTLIPIAVQAIITVVEGIINNLPLLINAAIQMIIALIQGIMNALPQLIAAIPQIIIGIINAIVAALPMLINAAPQIIVSIITGIIKAIPQLVMMVPQIIVAVVGGLIQAIPQLLTLGPQILIGIWNGLKNQDWGKIGSDILTGIFNGMTNIGAQISKVGNSIMSGFKDFFGIKSPSTMMRDMVGVNLGLGVTEGLNSVDFMGGMASKISAGKSAISSAMRSLSSDVQINASAFGGGSSGKTTNIDNSRAPVININGPVNLADKGSQNATLQQLQFLTAM